MVSESDSDMVISKRPKTKTKIGKELSNISDSEEHEDNLIQESKKDNSAFCKSVKEKKAIKRTRESDEESSITSDDEAMSKKRIRKNSDDRCVSFRPKKVVSDAARRRREAVKTVREKKMAALETDSESDSDVPEFRLIRSKTIQGEVESISGNKSEEDSVSKAEQHSDFEDEKVDRNPKSLIKSVKNRKSQREKTSEKTCAKNEESSSAYNSDSENGENSKESSENIRFEVEEKKPNPDNASAKFPKRKSSLSDMKKSGKCVDSGSDVDNSNHKHTTMACVKKKSLKKCDKSENGKCELDILEKVRHCVQTKKSDDEQNSSKANSDEDRNVSKEEKVKQKYQNTHSSCNENSSDEDNVNKKSTKEQKKVKSSKNSLINKQLLQDESSSDTDRPFIKTKSVKKTNSLGKGEPKLSQRKRSDSSSKDDTSNDDCPVKNSELQQKDVQRKGKALKQSLKVQNSSQEESFSENEHPSKKTKSSTKAQNYSDSSKSDNSFDLKSQNKRKVKKKDSESSDSNLENCEPSNKTKSLKYNKTQVKPKITVTKNRTSDTSDSEGESKEVKEKKIYEKVLDESERSKKKPTRSSKISSDEAVDSSDDSDLTLKKTKESETVNSSDDSEPTPKQSKESKGKVIQRKSDVKIVSKTVQKTSDESELSDSGSENNTRKKQKKPSKEKKERSDSETSSGRGKSKIKLNKSVEVSKMVKKEQISDSDSTTELSKQKVKHEISESANSSDSEYDKKDCKDTGNKTVKTKETNKNKSLSSDSDNDSSNTDSKKKKKALGRMEVKINNLKKYIRACGIFIRNYTTLWEGCKNDKQKADKLSKVLVDFGVKGRPSLQQCKKLRMKAERKREVEELDLSNIIDTEENASRSRCRSSRTHSIEKKPSHVYEEQKAAERAADWKQRFSRIKDLVDSDSSSG